MSISNLERPLAFPIDAEIFGNDDGDILPISDKDIDGIISSIPKYKERKETESFYI